VFVTKETCTFVFQPTNIFFATDNTIKVGDFGLVTALSVLPDQSFDGAISSPNAVDQLNLTNNVGTKVYMSPEQVSSNCIHLSLRNCFTEIDFLYSILVASCFHSIQFYLFR